MNIKSFKAELIDGDEDRGQYYRIKITYEDGSYEHASGDIDYIKYLNSKLL